ncbi:hypothetical protein [Phenylobacterium sp.]|uniref:hypothetical protein n=1 Tax=Phenylobacterium sp. TaxID=1871053 RepID=UPI0030F46103
MAQDPRSFSPTTVEANLTRQQGNGVGARELDAQQEADGSEAQDHLAEDLEAEGSHQGIGRRDGSPSDREHGVKTRAHSKDIISGRA